jgi:hypothetical protein
MKKFFTFFLIFLILSAASNVFAQQASSANSEAAEAYALTFFKKLNETQKKLTYMNKKSALAKVGTETVAGNISGSCFYDVKVKGAGGHVTLRYTNYCDEEGWIFDGEIITDSNMAQNGTFTGTVKMKTPEGSGTPDLEVYYDNVLLKKGAPGDGYYLVTLPDASQFKVDYSVYQKSLLP